MPEPHAQMFSMLTTIDDVLLFHMIRNLQNIVCATDNLSEYFAVFSSFILRIFKSYQTSQNGFFAGSQVFKPSLMLV
jgi:hypothetical protein